MATSPHFSDSELCCKGRDCCGGQNKVQPEILEALEALRSQLAKPITIMSGYRCPIHNRAIGGVSQSPHVMGIAADIRVEGLTPGELEAEVRKIPAFRGIGRDDKRGYVHVDVRPSPAQWCYDPQSGQPVKYYPAAA